VSGIDRRDDRCSVCGKPAPWRILNEDGTAYIHWCNRHHRELCPNDHSTTSTRRDDGELP
jgi:hypothetical protein